MENQQVQTSVNEELLRQQASQQYRAMISLEREYVLSDFTAFCQVVMRWPDFQVGLHDQLCRFLQDNRHKKRLILFPRGHLKSTIATVSYALWRIAQDQSIRILIANGTYDLATTFLAEIKDHLQNNAKFIELFGDLKGPNPEKWSENMITVRRKGTRVGKEPTVTAFGIGGNLVSQHYDLIICDDIVNRDNTHTPERIADVNTFYKDLQDLRDSERSEQIFIGTRWHEGDLYGTILDPDNPDRSQFAVYQRQAVEGDYQFVRNAARGTYEIEGGEIIFPNKFSREGIAGLISSKGMSEFSAQYMNDPVPSETAIFKHEFRYYEEEDIRGQDLHTYVLIDPTFYDPQVKKAEPDYTAAVVVSVNYLNDWFIRDIINQRLQPQELIELIFQLDTLWKPKTTAIESNAMQRILAYAARQQMRNRNHFPPITELQHAGRNARSKAERIQALEPRYAVGTIYHNKNVRHNTTLETQLRRFPRGKFDDIIDALASGVEVIVPPKRTSQRDNHNGSWLSYPA